MVVCSWDFSCCLGELGVARTETSTSKIGVWWDDGHIGTGYACPQKTKPIQRNHLSTWQFCTQVTFLGMVILNRGPSNQKGCNRDLKQSRIKSDHKNIITWSSRRALEKRQQFQKKNRKTSKQKSSTVTEKDNTFRKKSRKTSTWKTSCC